ncbi:hypothetical protein GCM10027261_29600 [Geodermatophilus arenarius]|uniref:Uncharacterized protein n=1 Tax=Geodermatophilus arenarius TaxID=1137990 RepID=A0ABV9LKQ9_9ACTN
MVTTAIPCHRGGVRPEVLETPFRAFAVGYVAEEVRTGTGHRLCSIGWPPARELVQRLLSTSSRRGRRRWSVPPGAPARSCRPGTRLTCGPA